MSNTIDQLTINLTRNNLLSETEFKKCYSEMPSKFPEDYLDFMKKRNGGEGFLNENVYIMLWKFEELIEFNKMYKVDEFAPELFLIGSDGSGSAFGIRIIGGKFVEVPFIGLSDEEATEMGENFVDLLSLLVN